MQLWQTSRTSKLFPVIILACLFVYCEASYSQEPDKLYMSIEEDRSVHLHVNAVHVFLCYVFLLRQSVSPHTKLRPSLRSHIYELL